MPELFITGPEGRLEARYFPQKFANAPVAIVLHPHPQHGGSMNNKVTFALYKTFVEMGFNTLRFNFRGVGKSEGKFDEGEGELADAATIMDWLQIHNPDAPATWVSGFSFGAWIGMQLLMRRPEIDGFISISPPANLYDFSFLAPCPVSGQILQGYNDMIVPRSAVDSLVTKLNTQKNITVNYQVLKNADHFFEGQLGTIMQLVKNYVSHQHVRRKKAG